MKNLRPLLALMSSVLLVVQSHAQSKKEADSSDILKALTSPTNQATRSIVGNSSGTKELTDDERQLLENINSRGLKIQSVDAVGKILEDKNLPSIDVDIQFEFNSAAINGSSEKQISELAKALMNAELQSSKILLNGHTDAKGEAGYNLELSQLRANTVKNYLVTKFDINPDRLVAIGFGETRLKTPDKPESGVNRRVEVVNIGN